MKFCQHRMNLLLKTDIFCTKRCLATVSNNSATTPFSLLVIRNGRQEVHARTLTSVCKSGIVFRDYFTLNRSVHGHSTRNCNSLHVSFVQSTFGKRSIKFKGPMLWNNLPAPLREPMSINKFGKLIKLYLTTDS